MFYVCIKHFIYFVSIFLVLLGKPIYVNFPLAFFNIIPFTKGRNNFTISFTLLPLKSFLQVRFMLDFSLTYFLLLLTSAG